MCVCENLSIEGGRDRDGYRGVEGVLRLYSLLCDKAEKNFGYHYQLLNGTLISAV